MGEVGKEQQQKQQYYSDTKRSPRPDSNTMATTALQSAQTLIIGNDIVS